MIRDTLPEVVLDWLLARRQKYNVYDEGGAILCRDFATALKIMQDFREYIVEFGKLQFVAISIGGL